MTHSSQVPIPVIDKHATFPTLLQATLYVDRFTRAVTFPIL